MAEDKGKKEAGGFFDNEVEEDYLSESTVVDTDVLKKLHDKLSEEEEAQSLSDDAELLEEVVIEKTKEPPPPPFPPPPAADASAPQAAPEPPKPPKPSIPSAVPKSTPSPASGPGPLASSSPSGNDQNKVDRVHELFEQADESDEPSDDEKTVILGDDEIAGMPQPKGAKLVVTEGPERGKEYTIEFNEIFIGRGVENDFVIPERSISRKHFRIRRRFDEYIIVDLGSGNGTRVNGARVSEAVLNHKDEIVIGRTTLRFVDLAQESTDKAAAPVPVQPEPKAEAVAEPVEPPKAEPKAEEPPKVEETPAAPVAAQAPPAQQPVAQQAPKETPPAAKTSKIAAQTAAPVDAKPAQPKPTRATPIEDDRPARRSSRDRFEPISAQRPGSQAIKEEEKTGGMGGIAIGIILVIIIVAGLILVRQYSEQESKPVAKAPAPAPVAQAPAAPVVEKQEVPLEGQVKKLIDQGNVLMQNKFYAKAVDKFNEALALDSGNSQAEVAKAQAQREIANREALEEGKKLFETSDYGKAAIRLKVIGEASVFYTEAQTYLKKIEDSKYDKQVEQGKKLLDQRKYDQSIAVFDTVLKEKPGHEAATKFRQIAVQEKAAAEQAKLASEQQKQARAAETEQRRQAQAEERKRKAEQERKQKLEQERKRKADAERQRKEEEKRRRAEEEAKKRQVSSTRDLDKGIGYYKKGDIEKSIVELYAIANGRGNQSVIKKAKTLVANIKKFNELYEAGNKAHKQKKAQTAIPKLKNAMRMDLKIASGSVFGNELSKKLADMYYLLGNSAKKDQNWVNAYKAYSRALKFYSGHGPSKEGLEDLSNQARKLYYEGFAIKDVEPEQAEKKWKTVKSIVPKSNQWYKKADQGLKEL